MATPDALDQVVDGLEIGLDGAELAQVQAAADRLLAKLGVAYGDFDAPRAGTWMRPRP